MLEIYRYHSRRGIKMVAVQNQEWYHTENSRYRYHFLLNPKTRYTHTDAVTVGAPVAARAAKAE